MRRFVLGDIHGRYDYLKEVLQKCNFNYDEDLLIQIGDIVDRGENPFECMDELLKAKHLVMILGNHDETFREFTRGKRNILAMYPSNGVQITEQKWKELSLDMRLYYKENVFEKMVPYYILDDSILFVHGGFDPSEPIDKQHSSNLTWDRELVNEQALTMLKGWKENSPLTSYKEVFIGHTPTLYYGVITPMSWRGVTNIDTGSGKGGPLTIMDIDTHEYWQSDYPDKIKHYGIIKKNEESEGEEQEEDTQQIIREAA